ncbi:hypothetical protein COF68_05885 [Bacillus toyonensis]|uniref:hypothetical protein n=1 Tax=Bacillus toyonensis TaxID=155322 RepID=UPI000BFC87A9|nr:hypothetical protein [Bacillus toyonensis]PHE64367.1 hypothetical protein COF68_05885 [Bacillus toyonensis]
MISLILGFTLPLLIWIVTLPLKFIVILAEKSLNSGKNIVTKGIKSIAKKEKDYFENNAGKIGRTARSTVKVGFALSKFALRVTFRTLKLLIRIINAVIRLLIWLSLVMSVLYTLIITGALVSVIAIIVMVSTMSKTSTGSNNANNNTGGTVEGGSSTDFMAIDWSQDFNTQLAKIEAEKGVEARNWVELSIITMNTMQKTKKDGKAEIVTPGFFTGLKAVETGQNSLSKKPNLTQQMVRYPENGSLDTPLQFDSTHWHELSPYYEGLKGERGNSGSAYYYPDGFYGLTMKFSKAGVNGFLPKRTDALYEKAFKDMGVEKTNDKLRFVRYTGNITNQYNAVFLEVGNWVPGLTAEQTNDTVYANAMLLIQFGELYGYDINEKVLNLVKSMYKTTQGNEFEKWFFNKDQAYKAIYGLHGGYKNYPEQVDKTTNYGVIDPNGQPVNGSLFNYLVDKMPETAKNNVWNSQGLKKYNSTRSHYMRARYDLSAYLMGIYDVNWATNALGLAPKQQAKPPQGGGNQQPSSSAIGDKIVAQAKKYAEDTSSNRITYSYDGIGNTQDCSSFVNGILRELGYAIDGTTLTPEPLANGNFTYVRNTGQMVSAVKKKPEVLVKLDGYTGTQGIPRSVLEPILQPGDILLSGDAERNHTAIYVGRNSKGDYVTIESKTSYPHQFSSHSDFELTQGKYGFGYDHIREGNTKYKFLIRMGQVIK